MSEDQEQGRHRHRHGRADQFDAANEPKDEPDVEAHRHEVLRDDVARDDVATGVEERGRHDEAI